MWKELEPQRLTTRPVLATPLNGKIIRAVGSELFTCPPGESFHLFLVRYLFTLLGDDWYEAEIAKPVPDRHIAVRWYWEVMEKVSLARDQGRPNYGEVVLTGHLKSLIVLADDLVQLAHALTTPKKVLDRLRNFREFQGARYEVAAASLIARCGFKIDFIDDSSRPQPEFIARSEKLSETIAVEAKSRHRGGVIHEPGEPDQVGKVSSKGERRSLNRLFRDALSKAPDDVPFVIFIDVNRLATPIAPYFEKESMHNITELLRRWTTKRSEQLMKLSGLVITNFAWHYHQEMTAPFTEYGMFPNDECNFPLGADSWKMIETALSQYGKVPDEEAHQRSVKERFPEFSNVTTTRQ